ncbi:MAG: CHASE2 domain-containing protein [Turneriella sp.]|nr:CHASE2 domain-containing protein [Turneriella sp.]
MLRTNQFLKFMVLVIIASARNYKLQAESKSIVSYIKLDNAYFLSIGGFPPLNRNKYLQLFDMAKVSSTRTIYIDLLFSRPNSPSETGFEIAMNRRQKVILPLTMTNEIFEENYNENIKFFGNIIPAYKAVDNSPFEKSHGIILPHSTISAQSQYVCPASLRPQQRGDSIRTFYIAEYYKEHILPAVSICILNSYLTGTGYRLELLKNGSELFLMKEEKQRWLPKRRLHLAIQDGKEIPLTITFEKLPSLSATEIIRNKKTASLNQIIILGTAADSIGTWVNTPVGLMSSGEVTANEVNTLWRMIQKDIR